MYSYTEILTSQFDLITCISTYAWDINLHEATIDQWVTSDASCIVDADVYVCYSAHISYW